MAHQHNIIMEQEMDRLSRMIFNFESTMRTDYQKLDLRKAPKTVHVAKSAEKKNQKKEESPFPNPKYVYTMTRWKNYVSPFDLYIHPNPVHGFDPRIPQKPFEPIGDPDREKAYKTRPRLVMTPAATLDDIKDPVAREIIINDAYTSTLNAAQRPTAAEAFPVDKNIKAPPGDTYAPPKPLDLAQLKPKSVSPEWRMESMAWDRKQRRGYVDATAMFWRHRPQ